jgi:hypothetical protein
MKLSAYARSMKTNSAKLKSRTFVTKLIVKNYASLENYVSQVKYRKMEFAVIVALSKMTLASDRHPPW